MRYVIVKKAAGLPLPLVKARNVVSHAMHGGDRAQRMAQVPMARFRRGLRPTAGAGFSAGAYEPAGLSTGIPRLHPRVPGEGRRMLDKMQGKTVTASQENSMRFVLVKKAGPLTEAIRHGTSPGNAAVQEFMRLQSKHPSWPIEDIGSRAGAKVTRLRKTLVRKVAPGFKGASHCPPGAKKKILLKHHRKDLDEAVKERDVHYARKTEKDIEEIAADKHAALDRSGLVARAAKRFKIEKRMLDVEGKLHGSDYLKAMKARRVGIDAANRAMDDVARSKNAEQLADELDMVEGVRPLFLREAPVLEQAMELPPLSSKLAYDRDGLRIPLKADIVESMLKIAAKGRGPGFGKLSPGEIETWTRTVRVDPAAAAAHAAQQATAQGAHAPVSMTEKALHNLGSTIKGVVTGEGGPGFRKAQMGLALGVAAGAALGIRHIYKKRQVQGQYDKVLNTVMEDPHFKNMNDWETRVPEAYAFLRRYAPTLAMDPVIARSFVRQAIDSDVGFMNQTVAQGLAEAETKHLDAGRSRHPLRDVLTHPFVAPFIGPGGKGSEGK